MRLRSHVLEPGLNSDEAPKELWSQLPSPEKVEESLYALLDGEIVLLVTTVQADRIGVFEKEKLRVLRLSADRSRSGSTPILEVESRTRNWYRPGMSVQDVNRDGHDDVILVQPKGLGAGKLVIEAFIGSGAGSFARKTRRTNLEVETETWSYGQDLDLDGLPDLVLIEGEALFVFTGVDETRSDLVVHQEPRWRIPVGEVDDVLQVRDVQGDRRPEILVIERRGSALQPDDNTSEADVAESSEDEKEPSHGRLSLIVLSSPAAVGAVSP